ncbi:MAG TPA: DUF3160 domain-containing protein, partial [Armatimonadota bacterium]|nr:DUF3160 domain-containing protein [Armatimonadota bacterium]
MMRWLMLLVVLTAGMTAFAQGFSAPPYTPKPIDARVPWYTVRPDLSNVSNRKILPKFTPEQQNTLATYGFVARPTAEEQLFYIYENNAYKRTNSFVTTDSVLHSYHIFYDFTLRYLERARLFATARSLSRVMLDVDLTALKAQHPPEIKTALTNNAAFFAIPLVLLGEKPALPAEVQSLVDTEITRINAHAEREDSLVTGGLVDYTQFIPRGHYTRSKEFQQYFRALMWYGLVPMPIKSSSATLQALIITDQLTDNAKARELWQQLYDPTVFYVGKTDDLSYYQYAPLVQRVFGNGSIDRFADTAKLATFQRLVENELPKPGIENYTFDDGSQGQQFRFMGQRFIPDSRILQELTEPKVRDRYFPMGLDVFAVLGSPRAAQLLDTVYQQTRYANYLSQRKKLQDEITALTPQEWQQNLYYGWMYTLLPLLPPRPEGYPAFMRNVAWQEKS